MRTLWTTDPGPDPALRQIFAADRPSAVATAVVSGVEVVVTLVDEHEDFDCHLGGLHHERCPEPGVRIWDRASGALIRAVRDVCDNGTGYPAVLVTVTVDGGPLAVVRDWARPPKVVDLETGRRVGTLPGHDNATDVQVIAIVELAEGPAVVTTGWDGILRVAALTTGRTTTVDTGERSNAVAVVHLAGRPVAATGRDAVTLWDLVDGTRAGVLTLADGRVPAAIVSWPDSNPMIAVLDFDGAIAVWDAGTGNCRPLDVRLAPRPLSIAAFAAADGRPLLGIDDGEAVNLWDVHADAPFGAPLAGPVRGARMLADGPGNVLIGSPIDDAVSVWRIDGKRPHAGSRHRSEVRCIAVTPDGWIVAGGGDGALGRWRLADGAREPDLGSLPGRVNALAAVFHQAQTYVLAVGGDLHGTQDGTLYRWADGHPLPAVALDHRGQVDIALTFDVDGEPTVLTAGCDGQIHLTQVCTGLRLGTIANTYPPRGIAVGLLAGRPVAAICGMFGPFAVWDLTTRAKIATPAAANVQIGEAARGWIDTGTGATVVTVHEPLVRVHNLLTGAVTQLQPGADEPVTALATTDDPARPAAVAIARTDGTVSIVDAATQRDICRLTLQYPATALTWAHDGQLILACRRDIHCVEVPAF
jgi:WD40 repeat protein